MTAFMDRKDAGVFTFIVNGREHRIAAASPVAAMMEMNRTGMAKQQASFAWMDYPGRTDTWYAAAGNFFD